MEYPDYEAPSPIPALQEPAGYLPIAEPGKSAPGGSTGSSLTLICWVCGVVAREHRIRDEPASPGWLRTYATWRHWNEVEHRWPISLEWCHL